MRYFFTISFLLLTTRIVQAQQAPPSAEPDDKQVNTVASDTTWLLQGQRQPTRPFLTLQDQLRTVAGVQVTPFDGSPGSEQVVRVRGASALAGSSQPLYVVDGLPALNDELTPAAWLSTSPVPAAVDNASPYLLPSTAAQGAEAGASPLQLLPPESIASVEVLAGPAAVARYGPLAANGVVSIRTRLAAGGADSLRWHLRYAAYGGVQQLRRRLALLDASGFATIANEAVANNNGGALPFASTQLGAGTDWQAETYRVAGLQQYQLSLAGQGRRTGVLASLDYRQQSGVLRNSSLSRYGLRLALAHRATERLRLQASVALGQTDQRLPYTLDGGGAVQAALTAPPTDPVRTAQGSYAGYGRYGGPRYTPNYFANPVAVADLEYHTPRTRRLLAQAGASYQLSADLAVELLANYQTTDLAADQYNLPPLGLGEAPAGNQLFARQAYTNHQLGGRLAVRYQRTFGQHRLGAEVAYHYLHYSYRTGYDYNYSGLGFPTGQIQGRFGSYEQYGTPSLTWPWVGVRYALADSVLTAEAGLSYARYAGYPPGSAYPSAQVRWQPRQVPLPLALWVGAGRTSVAGVGFGLFGPARLVRPVTSLLAMPAYQQSQRTDQLEAGLQLGRPAAALSGQLVGYYRRTQHALLPTVGFVPVQSGTFGYQTLYDEGTVHNLGLELTLTGTWQAGPLTGATRLAASANRNRVQLYDDSANLNPAFDNHPAATFYGLQQQGLNPADGTLRFATPTGPGPAAYAERQYLGSGIPAELLSVSQQLRLRRLTLDVQLDALLGYQVLNYQLATLDVPTGSANAAPGVLDRWTPAHTATSVPAAGRTYVPVFDASTYTNRLIENGSQLRLSSLTLAYQLPPRVLAGLSVWAGTQNLFVLSGYRGYDSNVSSGGSAPLLAGQDYGAVPVPRTWLLGVRAAL